MAMPKVLGHTSVTATEWFVLVLNSQAVLNTSALFLFIFLALFSVPEAAEETKLSQSRNL